MGIGSVVIGAPALLASSWVLPGGSGLAAPAAVRTAPLPIAERYRLADAFLGASLADLMTDADCEAVFTRDGGAILYRLGRPGQRRIMLADLPDGTAREIATEASLADALSRATGRTVAADRVKIGGATWDAATATLAFKAFGASWTLAPGGALTALPGKAMIGDAATSPDGRFDIVARDFNLLAVDRRSGRTIALTTDGTREQPYGRGIAELSDILAQGTDTPILPVSVRWSPDSRRILTWRLDTRGVTPLTVTQENPPAGLYPRSFSYIYPLAGTARLPQATRLVIDVAQAFRQRVSRIVRLQIPAEAMLYPGEPDMEWNGERVRVRWTERGYRQLRIYDADPASGQARVTARERGDPLVTITATIQRPAPELGGELVVSERSGWAQLYLVRPDDPDGGIPLTRGAWEVTSIDRVDAGNRVILLTGVGREPDRNPYARALYRVALDGSQPVLLTPEPLDHDVRISPDGRWAIDAMSSPTVPTRTVVRDLRDGHVVIELARADVTRLLAAGFTPPEPFRGTAADGRTPLYGMIWRPAHFDATRRYPVIDQVYTGPTTTDVPVTWRGAVMNTTASVAQLGAIVVSIDARGTSRRGAAFRSPAYRNLGEVGLDDHIAMIRQMAVRYPYIDTGRVGVYGGSAGGYDAARFILRRPAFFKVAVAWSGNHDLRLDKAWWPEVSMGDAPAADWERNSNLSVAGNLEGKLLLIHGDIDDNVPVTESYRLAAALIRANRDVDLVILPNTTHAVYQPFFWRKVRDYFVRHLLGEEPRR